MKKVLSKLINIDIKIINLNFYRFTFLFFISVFLKNCDAPESPSWQTQISLPLVSSQFQFSEMVESDGIILDDNGFISVEYSDPSLFPDDNVFELEDFFEIPGFDFDGFSSTPSSIPEIPSAEFPQNTISLAFDGVVNGDCIPEQEIINALSNFEIESFNTPIDFSSINLILNEFFENWSYINIGDADFNLSENINLFFPTIFSYQVLGYENDLIFDNSNFNSQGQTRIYDNLVFEFNLSYDFTNNSEEFIYCEQLNPITGEVVYTGWSYDSLKTSINLGGVNSSFSINEIESIFGTTKEQIIDQSTSISVNDSSMPFGILGGIVSSDNQDVNTINFQIINNSSFPEIIDFSLKLPNFRRFDKALGEYSDFFEINTSVLNDGNPYIVEEDGYLSDTKFQYYAGCNSLSDEDCLTNINCDLDSVNNCNEIINGIDSIYVDIEFSIPSVNGNVDLSNISDFSVSMIQINPIRLSEINTIIHDFEIDVASFTIPSPPEGSNIQGLKIVNPKLDIFIGNKVADIDNLLKLDLKSYTQGDSSVFTIEADLGYGENIISIQGSECTNSLFSSNCSTYDLNGESYPIAEFLQSSPDSIGFSGKATLNGSGSFESNDSFSISGGIGLELPFSFILGNEINDTTFSDLYIIPEVSTQLTPVDDETYESINNSLEEAALISNITNFSPLVGEISMIVSTDDSFFPSFLDSIVIISDEEFNNNCYQECIFTNDDSNINLNQVLINSIIDSIHYINQIDTVKFTPLTDSDFRVKSLKLIYGPNDDDYLLISRLAMIELPCPIIGEDGNVIEGGEGQYLNYPTSLEKEQIDLINFLDIDKPRYLNTMIALTNSFYPDCPYPNQNSDGIINMLGIHFIDIQSYASFKINVGEY
tara:strand:- start:15761 stop:18397 length:2637 start_codon:yes stop_codon:yes gene_type:complete